MAPHCDGLLLAVTSAGQVIVQAGAATVVIMVAELFDEFGSDVLEDTFAVKVMVLPGGVLELTLTTTVNIALAPAARLGFVQVIDPVMPTAGVVQLHPGGALSDWNVVLDERVSESETLVAGSGPPFSTDIL